MNRANFEDSTEFDFFPPYAVVVLYAAVKIASSLPTSLRESASSRTTLESENGTLVLGGSV
jgi:hypothetical protein